VLRHRFGCLLVVLSCLAAAGLRAQTPSIGQSQDVDSYIVLLRAPSVVEQAISLAGSVAERRRLIFGEAGRERRRSVEVEQERFAHRLRTDIRDATSVLSVAAPVEVLARRSFLVNMLVVRAGPHGLDYLRRQPEVRAIYPNLDRQMLMDTVPSIVSVADVWAMLGGVQNEGHGVRIGVIDSGVNSKHPVFSDSGFEPAPALPPGSYPGFTNNKVIAARNYVTPDFGYTAQPVQTPDDERGHGTCVASIAAGVPTATPLFPIQGMAPGAMLGNYKVFGAAGLNDSAKSAAVVAAISDAVEDGMDILNLSMGGSPRLPDGDIEQETLAAAAAVGTVVVIAAGNAGPGFGTIESPGTSPVAVTVGATLHARYFAASMEVSSPGPLPPELAAIGYISGKGLSINTSLGPLPLGSVKAVDPFCLACEPLPSGSLNGRVAVLRRGTCTFADKLTNVVGAGAVGMIVVQNVEAPPATMDGVQSTNPAVMVEQAAGEALLAFLDAHTADVVFRPQNQMLQFPWPQDQIAQFSSRGPDIAAQIKPDIVAPGERILAAVSVGGSIAYTSSASGTSFSSPITAGAAALLRQLHAGWPAEAIKSSLVNSADKTTTWGHAPARVMATGNGRLNVKRAAEALATCDPVSLSFGVIPSDVTTLDKTVEITNWSDVPLSIAAELVPAIGQSGASLSVSPSSMVLAPGESRNFSLIANLTQPSRYGVFEGYLRLTGATTSDLTVSYWGACSDTGLLQVSKTASAPFSSLAAALSAAQPGSTIEITDSSAYGPVSIGLNQDGVPLSGLTVRASQGAAPTIEALGTAGLVAIGAQRLSIDGISFSQGLAGLALAQSSGTIIDCAVDSPQIGMFFDQSQFSLVRDTIAQSKDHSIAASGSELILTDSTIQASADTVWLAQSSLLIQRSVISQGAKGGLWASQGGAMALFDSVVDSNASTGVELLNSPALIKNSWIHGMSGSRSHGVAADGPRSRLEIYDSRITSNGGDGITASAGAELDLVGLRAQGNQGFGLSLSGASARAHAGWFTGNVGGIRSDASNLDITDSLIARSTDTGQGDGICQTGGALNLFNSTIALNATCGVVAIGAVCNIANNILSQNAAADLEGVSSQSASSNLIGDGLFNGLNLNFQADPRFVRPLLDDYSLSAASPAIDIASDAFPISLTDVKSHERVVDGNGDGQSKADLGAFEYGSRSWTPLILPVLSTKADEFVGLAMVDSSSETSKVQLKGYDTAGQPFGEAFEKTIEPGSQFSILLNEALGPLSEGWVEIRSSQPDLMCAALTANWGLTRMDGAALAGATGAHVLLPEIMASDSADTRVFVVNPNNEAVDVRIIWRRSGAVPAERLFAGVPAKGALSLSLLQVFPNLTSSGYLIVENASGNGKALYAMELFGNGRSLGGLLGLDTTRAASRLYGTQLASTSEVETIINLVNLGATTDVTAEAFDESGKLVKSVLLESLAEGEQRRVAARDLLSLTQPLTGWIRISSATGKLLGSLTFSDPGAQFIASLPLQSQGAREFALDHVAQTPEVFTGIALLNPGPGAALVSVEAFNASGVSQGLDLIRLAAGEKRARLLFELIPGLVSQQGGFLRVRSNAPLFGYELFGNYQLTFMSAVPPQVTVW
jgi:minor extracellular serine protease Vpr